MKIKKRQQQQWVKQAAFYLFTENSFSMNRFDSKKI